jgi:hypothetical protein
MKFNRVVLVGAASLIASTLVVSGYVADALANSSIRSSNSAPVSVNSGVIAQGQTTAIATGTFVAAEAPTTGTARIVTENGHRYLEIDSAFSTTNQAPDLHVLLDTTNTPPKTYSNFGSYINLGKLQSVTGAQRYPIPDAIDLASYKSVVIWCRMANATMGYAPLGGSSSAQLR